MRAESVFFKSYALICTVKQEELYRRKINSEVKLYRIIENYINFYNSERLHSANHYKSPDEYEEEYYKK
ncbi:MAG: IS3 family transposase [Ruminococcus sp.]|nr:IS3 family transposase [Ruminococcus sp.]